jgi:hypothetical protein
MVVYIISVVRTLDPVFKGIVFIKISQIVRKLNNNSVLKEIARATHGKLRLAYLLLLGSSLMYSSTLKMEAIRFSETSVD